MILKVRASAVEGLSPAEKLPLFYGKDRLILLTRDPYWLYTYWEVTPAARQRLEKEGQRCWEHLSLALRVKRYADSAMLKEESCYHLPINHTADNWCLEVGVPDRYYQVELGAQVPGKGFIALLCSNMVKTPRDEMSSLIDENWRLPDWQAKRLYRRITRGSISSLEMSAWGGGSIIPERREKN